MDLHTLSPDDSDGLHDWVAVSNAVHRHDAPWEHDLTLVEVRGRFTHGWDGEPRVPVLGSVEGVPVAAGTYGVSGRDNLHLAWLGVDVAPEHRRRGHGTTMLHHLERTVAGLGRTSIGISCWDLPSTPEEFALHHGYERRSTDVNRRQYLDEVDPSVVDRVHAEAVAAAPEYELLRRLGRSPDDELEALAVMTAAINDAPKGGLDIEDEVFDADRVRAYEDAQLARGYVLHRLVARHRGTGELAGQTVVVVDAERPHLAEQHDTSVVAAHRGHRLGALLKADMLRWLRDEQPQVAEIDTWNAESNSFMIGVNERLGYRVMGRGIDLQKSP